MNSKTEKIVIVAMLSSIAFVLTLVGRIPIVLFLKYDPKDFILVLGGFLWGAPVTVFATIIVSFIEMLTISATGIIGFMMNIIATLSFVCPPAILYRRKHSLKGAAFRFVIGTALMTITMILWNYLLTPIFMKIPREQVVPLLWSAILPFNIIKSGLNTALAMIFYKPIVSRLRNIKTLGIATHSAGGCSSEYAINEKKSDTRILVVIISLLIIAACIALTLYIR